MYINMYIDVYIDMYMDMYIDMYTDRTLIYNFSALRLSDNISSYG